MKVTFASPYLSIQSFPEIELPPFTVVTGVNGAGKTHLLKAINDGYMKTDIAPNHEIDTKFFDWTNLVPNDTGACQTAAVYSERDQFLQWLRESRTLLRGELMQWATQYGLVGKIRVTSDVLFKLDEDDLAEYIPDTGRAKQAWSELKQLGDRGVNRVRKNARNNAPILEKIGQLQQQHGFGFLSFGVREFEDEPFGWGQVDVFQQSFAQLFLSYFELVRQNLLRRHDELEGRKPSIASLSDEEFEDKYGRPPWMFVNEILAGANLDFSIDYPIEYSTSTFTPQLTKNSNGVELQFSELSSGERILMSFAFCLYHSLDYKQVQQLPKLLLFDEIDAPLHPSMSRQLIDTIEKSLVTKEGVQVILATHSPSTVAVAPEESVYVMRPDEPGLHKVGKRQAISVLTVEIPTLSIDFSGRRQVFVESGLDASRYDRLFQLLGGHIDSERSLAFIPVGRKKDQGEENAGCDQVKSIVEGLTNSGNESVFGLIDWDQKSKSEGRIFVLAEGSRYAIENCLLDPLLVGALAIRTNRSWGEKFGLSADLGFHSIKDFSGADYQTLIDGVESVILGLSGSDAFGARREVRYLGGFSAQVSEALLVMNGHDLEEMVKNTIPILKKFHNKDELLMEMIDPTIFEMPELVPIELLEVFEAILSYETTQQ